MKTKRIFVGADVHSAVTVIEAQTDNGKTVMEAKVPTTVSALSHVLRGLGGQVQLAFEEGSQAEWLHERLSPVVHRLVVCDPRRNKAMQGGNKNDRVSAHDLCKYLRTGLLRPVYHGSTQGLHELKQHVFSRDRLVQDATRTKLRLISVFRSRGLGRAEHGSLYAPARRESWLALLDGLTGEQARARRLFLQLDLINELVQEAENDMLRAARRHRAWRLVKTVPGVGDVRASAIVAKVVTPHRFRTKRQFWQYCGFGVVHRRTDEYLEFGGQISRRTGHVGQTRGLNRNYSRLLKEAFKGAAVSASGGVFADFVQQREARGMRRQMALLTLARKLAAITLAIWKKGERFDIEKALTSR
jgi:transposase